MCSWLSTTATSSDRTRQDQYRSDILETTRRSTLDARRTSHPLITMSSVYATEPPTSGRVIFETTHGPLDIQLWCKECPETTRFFLQLCLDDFYRDMVFHRILPNFLIQTGAMRYPDRPVKDIEPYRRKVNAEGALDRRQYEINSRIRFNHRGQIAMAMGVSDDDTDAEVIQPQFFITLDECSHLDGKHVLFGTVTGPTVFNALRIGNCEIDEETQQPVDLSEAPRVKSVKIVENPIHTNLVAQDNVPWREVKVLEKKKKKRKGKFDTNVLSFGDEVEDTFVLQKKEKKKPKQDIRDVEEEKKVPVSPDGALEPLAESEPRVVLPVTTEADAERTAPSTREASMSLRDNEKPKLSALEAQRAKYLKGGKQNKQQREDATMEKLFAFQKKVKKKIASKDTLADKSGLQDNSLASRMARRAAQDLQGSNVSEAVPTYHGQVMDDDGGVEGSSSNWMATRFKCRKHMDLTVGEDKARGGDGRAADDYKVIDEREEGNRRRHDDHRHHNKHKKHRRQEGGDRRGR